MAMRSSQEEQFWDNNSSSSKILVINELQNAVEAAKQLRILHHFDKSLFLSSAEKLLDEIISSSERALTMLSHSFQADSENTREPVSKKRKTIDKCTKRVRVSLETGIDGYVEDGFNWRKYGQKYIQGASHPRGYYRCTHKQQSGCSAMKHVQRSDEDPLIFYITYRGKHTCYMQHQNPPPLPVYTQTWTNERNHGGELYETWIRNTTVADMSLPPFPDDICFGSSQQLAECNNATCYDSGSCPVDVSNQKAAFEKLSTADWESQVESDDGSHLSFDFSSFLSFD